MSVSGSQQSVQVEPAFLANDKYARTRAQNLNRSLADCCYSVANLALIIGCILAIIFVAKFVSDDPLYELGEYLLSLQFYRQLIYVLVILPLVLLVPMFNAASAFFLSKRHKQEIGSSLLTVKLVYESLMIILVFIALAFIAPNIRYSSVANQLAYELRRHMGARYLNEFSYEFIDRIQEEFQCCDELWYRENPASHGRMPITCFLPDGLYTTIYEQTCDDVLGSLVSNRCSIISAGLVMVLVALAILISLDILELIGLSANQYNVGSREAKLASGSSRGPIQMANSNGLNGYKGDKYADDDGPSNGRHARPRVRPNQSVRGNRVPQHDIEPQTPLLSSSGSPERPWPSADTAASSGSPVLTRAHYLPVEQERAQSPLFMTSADQRDLHDGVHSSTPTRGVLKKTSSFQRIDDQADSDSCSSRGRRSLLNVRFADD